ncbi:MAG: PAS domain-containing protein [Lachnospiraceae bacterium]|nr:PAS domain-containing protein [Lachnospiraceae bacterium]
MFKKKTIEDDSAARIAELEAKLKECNEKLALSEYELMAINRSAHLGLWKAYFNEAGEQIGASFSDEFRSLLGGYTKEEVPDEVKTFLDLIHRDDINNVMKAYTASTNDRTGKTKYDIDFRLKIKNGKYKWYHAYGDCIRRPDGSPKEFISTFYDVDDAKKNEEAVRSNNVRRKALDRLMHEGSWSIDLLNNAMDDPSAPAVYNKQIKKILGFDENDPEFPDTAASFGSRIHPKDIEIAVSGRDNHLNDPSQPIVEKEFRMRKKNGEYIWVRASNTVVCDDAGTPLMCAGTVMDITTEKKNQLKFKNEMSPSIEALRNGIAEISKTVDEAAAQMVEIANRQQEVTEAAKGIEKSVKASKNILNSIEGIASQTNLLSLNASIEAARVGEAGRGFSVVAKNVRELSDSTKKTTEHIAEILNGMNDSVKEMQEKISEINESVQKEKDEMEVIDSTVEELYASADEISRMASELYK